MREFQKIEVADISVDYTVFGMGCSEQMKSSCHDCYELIYVTQGNGKCSVESKTVALISGMLVLCRPLEYHGFSLGGVQGAARYVIKFPASALSESNLALLDRILGDASGVYYSSFLQEVGISAVFEKMRLASTLPESEREAFITALLIELIILLSATPCEKIVNTDDTLVPRVIRYINSNIHSDLRLDAISGQFFVNKCYLCRAFKQYSGISIHTYINQKRVLYAKLLIESGEVASRAAEKVGFGDYSAFYRAYVKYLGVPPTAHQPKRGGAL